ncbi:SIMPL domain-containing protein [Candidatus Roizmanbacteria bacterium]|nr:SIMPL domain-containing protein [Candidatus Roizmanbacteria bacterium]
MKSSFFIGIGTVVALFMLFLLGAFLLPWQRLNWGILRLGTTRTITVIGQAKSEERSQIATFTAGVAALSDKKETATAEVNQKVAALIDAVKAFGITPGDIKTQSINVYQMEEQYYEGGRQKNRPGQWRVSNDITITLRDVDQASQLTDVLTQSGATTIYGPNFTLDDTTDAERELLQQAIADAREKATRIATNMNGSLGQIVSVSETDQGGPILFAERGLGGGGSAPVEPGTGTVTTTLTVVFEVR